MQKTLVLALSLAILAVPAVASAQTRNQIKRPGLHPRYGVEIEPHLVFDWNDHNGPGDDDAVGLGLRATIPIIDNGPIDSLNNSMGIGFGLDWTHNGDACDFNVFGGERFDDDCTVDNFHFPLVMQWNFWLTPIISVFGEAGLDIVHTRWEWEDCPWDDDCEDNDTDVEPAFFGGGRFLFGANSNVGGVVRVGWPYVSLGVGFLW